MVIALEWKPLSAESTGVVLLSPGRPVMSSKSSDRFQVLPLPCFPGLESPTMKKNNVRI